MTNTTKLDRRFYLVMAMTEVNKLHEDDETVEDALAIHEVLSKLADRYEKLCDAE